MYCILTSHPTTFHVVIDGKTACGHSLESVDLCVETPDLKLCNQCHKQLHENSDKLHPIHGAKLGGKKPLVGQLNIFGDVWDGKKWRSTDALH